MGQPIGKLLGLIPVMAEGGRKGGKVNNTRTSEAGSWGRKSRDSFWPPSPRKIREPISKRRGFLKAARQRFFTKVQPFFFRAKQNEEYDWIEGGVWHMTMGGTFSCLLWLLTDGRGNPSSCHFLPLHYGQKYENAQSFWQKYNSVF
jgi:hypothetical protein